MTPEELLQVYRLGGFPMAESRKASAFSIYEPIKRALLPIKELHIPKRLKRKILQFPFEVKVDTDFPAVIRSCADARPDTWINDAIEKLFIKLHEKGVAHSIECWKDGKLAGGLYGLELGGTFCGESMFSRETDASKVALVHLCARLDAGEFTTLDAQFRNPHLDQFGLYEVGQGPYLKLLHAHLHDSTDFDCKGRKENDLIKEFLDLNLLGF